MCDVCNKNIVPIAVVTVCGRCKHVRHLDCTKVPCTSCGSWLKRSAVYRTGKIMRYF